MSGELSRWEKSALTRRMNNRLAQFDIKARVQRDGTFLVYYSGEGPPVWHHAPQLTYAAMRAQLQALALGDVRPALPRERTSRKTVLV